ncbi:MAG: hypothetical protein LUE27_03250 [Clostridia bacterium]|nr:hypothetical protein [Clostridia bacterium]
MKANNLFAGYRLFTTDDVRGLFSTNHVMYERINEAIERGTIKRVVPGLYCSADPETDKPVPNRFEIATALFPDGCCSYRTALEYYGLLKPDGDTVQVCKGKHTADVGFDGLEYRVLLSRLDFGIDVISSESAAPVRVTDIERTILDCLDKPTLVGPPNDLSRAFVRVENASEQKMLDYLERYGKKFLYKKTGFFFSLLKPSWLSSDFFEACRKNMIERPDYMYSDYVYGYEYMRAGKRVLNKEWELYVPTYFEPVAKRARKRYLKGLEQSDPKAGDGIGED